MCEYSAHLIGDVKDALLNLLIDLPGCVDESLRTTAHSFMQVQADVQVAVQGAESSAKSPSAVRLSSLVEQHACADAELQTMGALASSTLWAVFAEVSRNTSPCSLANCSPSSVVTARRCCSAHADSQLPRSQAPHPRCLSQLYGHKPKRCVTHEQGAGQLDW